MKILIPFIAISVSAYYAYKVIKDALEPPEDVDRQLVLGYDEFGNPITDPDCDIDVTLDMWKSMARSHRRNLP